MMPSQLKEKRVCRDRAAEPAELGATLVMKGRWNTHASVSSDPTRPPSALPLTYFQDISVQSATSVCFYL